MQVSVGALFECVHTWYTMCHLALPAVPSPPTNLTAVETTPTSLSIEWGPPLQPNEVILQYELHYIGIETLNLVPSSFHNETVIQYLAHGLKKLIPRQTIWGIFQKQIDKSLMYKWTLIQIKVSK